MRLRAYSVSNSTPSKKEIKKLSFSLHIVKRCNLDISALFYFMDAIQLKLTYILFYNVFINVISVFKITNKVLLILYSDLTKIKFI